MKLRSFRIRIALLSAVLAGSALAGFGAISWWLIYEAKVSRLDAELESQLLRAGRPRSVERWQSYEASLPRSFGTDANTPIALLVIDANGQVVFRSEQWTLNLPAEQLWREKPPRLSSLPTLPPTAPTANPPSGVPDAGSVDPERPNSDRPNFERPNSDRSTFERPNSERPNADHSNPRLPDFPPPQPRFMTQRTPTGTWRIGSVTTPVAQVAIAVSLNAVDQEMVAIRNIFLISIPGVLLLVAGGAWAIAESSLYSVRRLATVIGTVTAKGLEQRVPIGATEVEFVELIQVFNQMLERLERSFKQASRFSADAAHELKTPLAILQGELERTLQQADPGSEVQQNLSNLLDEVRRLSGIVRKLLLLSLADAGQMKLHRVPVDLSGLLLEMLEDIELLAPQLEIQPDIAAGLQVQGDRDLLVQVLQNLISNAIKYNLPAGWIQIQAQHQTEQVAITIRNASKGIPSRDRDLIFDRFHRGDPARTRKVEGIGLGLSLAREIARAHRGDLTLDPIVPGQTAFTLTLPGR